MSDKKLEELKEEAKEMGLTVSGNIGIDTLQKKINEAKEPKTKQETLSEKIKEANKLIRVKVTNLDPNERDLPGQLYTISNSIIGTIRKHVFYLEELQPNGYQIPNAIVKYLERQQFAETISKKGANGREISKIRLRKKFQIERLPQLTKEELEKEAYRQKSNASID